MQNIIFEYAIQKLGLSYSFRVFSIRDAKRFIPDMAYEKELNYPNNPSGDLAFLLENGMVVVKKEWSWTFFPSLGDFEKREKVRANAEAKVILYDLKEYEKFLDTSSPKVRIQLLPSGEEITFAQYDKKNWDDYIEQFNVKREELITKTSKKIFGQDKRFVFLEDRPSHFQALVFENEAHFDLWYNIGNLSAQSRVWCGRNPFGKSILEHKEELFNVLAGFLDIPQSCIQFEPGKHHILHRKIRKLIFTDEIANKLFLPLVLYLGEFQIKNYGGEWELEKDESINTWIPLIRFGERTFDIGGPLYWELLSPDNKKFHSLSTILNVQPLKAWKKNKNS